MVSKLDHDTEKPFSNISEDFKLYLSSATHTEQSNSVYEMKLYSFQLIDFTISHAIEKPYVDTVIVELCLNWSKETCYNFCVGLFNSTQYPLILEYSDFDNSTSEDSFTQFFEKYSKNGGVNKLVLVSTVMFMFENNLEAILMKTFQFFAFEEENKLTKNEFHFFWNCFFHSIIIFMINKSYSYSQIDSKDLEEIVKKVYDKDKLSSSRYKSAVSESDYMLSFNEVIDALKIQIDYWKFLMTVNLRFYEGFKLYEKQLLVK